MSKVFIKIPKTGLGNMMIVWAYGIVFAHKNGLPVTVSKWWGFRWGALLRRERKKRLYHGYFKEESLAKIAKAYVQATFATSLKNPHLHQIAEKSVRTYIFDKLPANNYFINLASYEDFVKEQLLNILSPNVQQELDSLPIPQIGIHIRRGDFKAGNHLTPVSHFIEIISLIRNVIGTDLCVTVFTDAEPAEIREILEIGNVKIHKGKYDITDILLLSKSRFLVLSRDSSFSYWAAFLSEAFVIMHAGDWQKKIKETKGDYYEFRYEEGKSKEELASILSDTKIHIAKMNTRSESKRLSL